MIPKEILYCWLLVVVFIPTGLQASQVDDIRVVIDVSGSMVQTDPENLRVPALRMLNGLIPTGSKAGVWTFGRYVNMEVKWGSVDANWRKRADAGAEKIHSRGQFTNIERALQRSTSGWDEADSETRRSIILLTDGKVDVSKNAETNELSKASILSETIPQLVAKGVQVHAIALSNESDEDLLKRIALDTSGSFEVAQSADDLQRIFLRMFERAVKPDTVPIEGNKFSVDKSISEMTLLVFRKGDQQVRLIQPDGVEQTQQKHEDYVRWRNDLGYDLITVTEPVSGEWTLDADVDDSNRVMIVADLKLAVDELPAYTTPDQDIQLKVELQNKDRKISKNSFLKFVNFQVVHTANGVTATFPLKLKESRELEDKGIYLQSIEAPLDEGSHEVVVSADSRTFKRNKRFTIEVQWPVVVDISKTDVPGSFRLGIQARPEYMQPDSLMLEVQLEYPDGELKPLELTSVDNNWQADIRADEQDGLHRLKIEFAGTSVSGNVISHDLPGYSILGVKREDPAATSPSDTTDEELQKDAVPPIVVPEEPSVAKEGKSLTDSIILILIVNVVIVLVAAGVFIYLRKKKPNAELDLMQEDKPETPGD